MQLTTPEVRDYDTVFPGENWFFYWRTSPSLWETKLSEYQGTMPVFIPIYWGLHSENPDQYDFGTYRPETDLQRLFQITEKIKKPVVFLLPVTPAPFLPNGGLPSYISRTISVDASGLGQVVIDNDGRLNKMYSFYDPRVFQAFRKFAWQLGQYFTRSGIGREIFGVDSCYITEEGTQSYFDDHSLAFEHGFSRYIKQLEPSEFPGDIADPKTISLLKKNYRTQIKNLYGESAQEGMTGNWSGCLSFAFLGGAPSDVFGRSSELWEHYGDFFLPLLKMVVSNVIPSSVLLSPKMKKSSLVKAINDIVTNSFIQQHLSNDLYEDDFNTSFTPLIFFELYADTENKKSKEFEKAGLISYLDREYCWAYRLHGKFSYSMDYEYAHRIHYFAGKGLDINDMNNILKLFMNGGRIFLDTSRMAIELSDRLHSFIVENELKTEKINYMCPIMKATLGEGMIVTFEADKVAELPLLKKLNFWDTLVGYLKLKHLKVQVDDQLFYLWKSRISNTYELDYEEIRRVSFYNPTSYKKKAHIVSSKNFAFLRTVDEKNAKVKSTPIGIDVDLLPGGSVSLDFGYYE